MELRHFTRAFSYIICPLSDLLLFRSDAAVLINGRLSFCVFVLDI